MPVDLVTKIITLRTIYKLRLFISKIVIEINQFMEILNLYSDS